MSCGLSFPHRRRRSVERAPRCGSPRPQAQFATRQSRLCDKPRFRRHPRNFPRRRRPSLSAEKHKTATISALCKALLDNIDGDRRLSRANNTGRTHGACRVTVWPPTKGFAGPEIIPERPQGKMHVTSAHPGSKTGAASSEPPTIISSFSRQQCGSSGKSRRSGAESVRSRGDNAIANRKSSGNQPVAQLDEVANASGRLGMHPRLIDRSVIVPGMDGNRGRKTPNCTKRTKSSGSGAGPEKPPMSWPLLETPESERPRPMFKLYLKVSQSELSPDQVGHNGACRRRPSAKPGTVARRRAPLLRLARSAHHLQALQRLHLARRTRLAEILRQRVGAQNFEFIVVVPDRRNPVVQKQFPYPRFPPANGFRVGEIEIGAETRPKTGRNSVRRRRRPPGGRAAGLLEQRIVLEQAGLTFAQSRTPFSAKAPTKAAGSGNFERFQLKTWRRRRSRCNRTTDENCRREYRARRRSRKTARGALRRRERPYRPWRTRIAEAPVGGERPGALSAR